MKTNIITFLLLLCLGSTSNATLIDRGNGLIYDDVLNVTWLQDANLSATERFGVPVSLTSRSSEGMYVGGNMNWSFANEWIAGMNQVSYLGINSWRLPSVSPSIGNTFRYDWRNDGQSDIGQGIISPMSELSYMFYVNLGNSIIGCDQDVDGCLENAGPFINLSPWTYWYSETWEVNSRGAWAFEMKSGTQTQHQDKSNTNFVWAVFDGDVARIPEPSSLALFFTALLMMLERRYPSKGLFKILSE